MKILILGGDGMLGHQLLKSWSERHAVCVTLRGERVCYDHYELFHNENAIYGVDVRDFITIEKTVESYQPEVVVNAIGIVKQRVEAHDAIISIEVNSLLPHRLSLLCEEVGARFIHLSTDCVFSGCKGMYNENDQEDSMDLYGRSKLLGEVHGKQSVTLRTSIIGLELARKQSLVEWFLAQTGVMKGFSRAVYSGFTTLEMARIIEYILIEHKNLHGLYHVASKPISKYDLLIKLKAMLGRGDMHIIADDTFICDRSLDGTVFSNKTAYVAPSWDVMLNELATQIKDRN